jgi:hypothetical protein
LLKEEEANVARTDRRPAPPAAPTVARPTAARAEPVLAESDDRSAPAARVEVSPAVKKWTIWILVGAAIIMGIGQITRISSGDKKGGNTQTLSQECVAPFSEQVNKCKISEEPVVLNADRLTAAGEFEFCVVVPDNSPHFHIEQIRTNTLKLWSSGGTFPIEYKMIRRENLVNGKCPGRF